MKTKTFSLFVLAGILISGNIHAGEKPSIIASSEASVSNHDEDRDWRFIYDDQGRALILHGTGISNNSKWKPDANPWVKREDVLKLSRDWGADFVRYLIFWTKIEPQPGVYDEEYLNAVEERMNWFADAGINVVLDMHQDLWGMNKVTSRSFLPTLITIRSISSVVRISSEKRGLVHRRFQR